MLKLLIKKQMLEIFRSYFYDAKKNKVRSRFSTAMYILMFVLLIVGLLGGIFTFLSVKLCAPLHAAGMDWLYFALMGLIALLLGAFGSVFNTYTGLYLPKDNDLLLSLPIPVSVLVTSRLCSVYLMGLLYSGIVILPAIIVYWITAGRIAADAADFRVCADTFLRAWLGRGKNQPETETQEPDHGFSLACVYWRILFRLFQGAWHDPGFTGTCGDLWCGDQR